MSIINHPSDLDSYLMRKLRGEASADDVSDLADKIAQAAPAAGYPLSSDWGPYLERWEKAKWQDPDQGKGQPGNLTSEERAELEALRAQKANFTPAPPHPSGESGQ